MEEADISKFLRGEPRITYFYCKGEHNVNILETDVLDVYIIEPQVFGDHRGWFMESWSQRKLEEKGLYYNFVQDNQSYSAKKGTLRGLHFQNGEASQAKLVYCIKGAVLDVAVDLRKGSPTYKKWVAVELSEENKRQMLIPRGFAHGFVSLTDNVEFFYKVDNFYDQSMERIIRWNDPTLAIDWGVEKPIIAKKDANAPLLESCYIDFKYNQ